MLGHRVYRSDRGSGSGVKTLAVSNVALKLIATTIYFLQPKRRAFKNKAFTAFYFFYFLAVV